MRLSVEYLTRYTYDPPARSVMQLLRLTPRDHAGQTVIGWQVEADIDARMRRTTDTYGNVVHRLQSQQSVSSLTLSVRGEVETFDRAGVLAGQDELHPPAVFLRPTLMTGWHDRLDVLLDKDARPRSPLDCLHGLMGRIHDRMSFSPGTTTTATRAVEAFELAQGVCQDFAHIFIACARQMGIPARYVSGHLFRRDGAVDQPAAHAWAEAWIEGLGWVGFDPANGICPDDAYVRVAVGPDYLDAAPVRGASFAGGGETLSVQVAVSEVHGAHGRRSQVQRQGQD